MKEKKKKKKKGNTKRRRKKKIAIMRATKDPLAEKRNTEFAVFYLTS